MLQRNQIISPELDRSGTSRAAAAELRLGSSAYAPLHRVSCTAEAGNLVLRGRVPSFYLKQLAQELIRGADDGQAILNELVVDGRDDPAAN